jgi:ribonuclease HI
MEFVLQGFLYRNQIETMIAKKEVGRDDIEWQKDGTGIITSAIPIRNVIRFWLKKLHDVHKIDMLFIWVKGHEGFWLNERADGLCNEAYLLEDDTKETTGSWVR